MSVDAEPYSLVLGAGGRPGLAYHAGTLLALELHGFRPLDACSITGTSAGAIATGLLSVGARVEDLAAYSVGVAPREEFQELEAVIRAADRLALALDRAALLQLADVRRFVSFAMHLRARRLPAAIAAIVPGLIKISHRFAFLDTDAVDPAQPVWRVVAADSGSRRHVFTAGEAKLSLAVAASCAVPGLFAPVAHEGRRLVDGGVHSTTNADLAVDDGAGTVIVLAPMCTRPAGAGGRKTVALADVTLAREQRELLAAGKRVVVFRPSPSLRRLMGWNPLSTSRSGAIVAQAFLEAADVIAELGPPRRQPGTALVA